MLINGLVYM